MLPPSFVSCWSCKTTVAENSPTHKIRKHPGDQNGPNLKTNGKKPAPKTSLKVSPVSFQKSQPFAQEELLFPEIAARKAAAGPMSKL